MTTPAITQRWVRLYTVGLPEQVRTTRRDEIASDVYEQLAEAHCDAERRQIRREVVGRTARGAVDDLLWRREVARGMGPNKVRVAVTQAWWAPVAVLVGLFDVAFAVAVLADEQSTMPGRVVGPVLVLITAVALTVGLLARVGQSHVAGGGTKRAGIAGLVAVIAMVGMAVVGGPVTLGLGAVVVVGALAVAISALGPNRGSGLANGMILLGALPALAMFWLIVPAVLALVLIAGVLTSRSSPSAAPA